MKGCEKMRQRKVSFSELVEKNKKDILSDNEKMKKIEEKIENKYQKSYKK